MHQVRYDLPEAQSSLEFILEQVIHGTEVIIVRRGIEVARIIAAPAEYENASSQPAGGGHESR